MKTLTKKIKITGKLKCLSGIRVGGNREAADIGGIDNPVIRCVLKDRQPYIPGSSIKGKIRSLLQQAVGEENEIQKEGSKICELFGASNNTQEKLDGRMSRLIVRDAYLTEDSGTRLKDSDFTDMPFTEAKMENRIDRITGKSDQGVRTQERVPAGAEFEVHFVINVFKDEDEEGFKNILKAGISMLNDDYLGGSGSRGYGHVKLDIDWEQGLTEKNVSEYKIPGNS